MDYQFTAIYQDKNDPANYFTPTLVAFTKRDLNAQIMRKQPDNFRYIRTIQVQPGDRSILNPMMPDMVNKTGVAPDA